MSKENTCPVSGVICKNTICNMALKRSEIKMPCQSIAEFFVNEISGEIYGPRSGGYINLNNLRETAHLLAGRLGVSDAQFLTETLSVAVQKDGALLHKKSVNSAE